VSLCMTKEMARQAAASSASNHRVVLLRRGIEPLYGPNRLFT